VIVDNQMIAGTAIELVDRIMEFIRKNTNVRLVVTEKPTHDQVWDYPLDALREAVTNAICHRDYRDRTEIQLKIHDDRLTIWNPGGLLLGMTIDELYNPNHSSVLRNQLIGQVFHDVEMIERYGGGIHKILDACEVAGVPLPTFEERFGGFLVTFYKDIYSEEHLRTLGLNERQVKAVERIHESGRVANREYQELNAVSKRTASTELNDLVRRGIVDRVGSTGKGTDYVLKGATKGQQRGMTGSNGKNDRNRVNMTDSRRLIEVAFPLKQASVNSYFAAEMRPTRLPLRESPLGSCHRDGTFRSCARPTEVSQATTPMTNDTGFPATSQD
jgi:ATP-dependent DNA helicase RecG